jgi:sugar phosphate permease
MMVQGSVAAVSEKPTHKRFTLLAILLLTITVAYIDRVNITVLMADPAFLNDLGLTNNPAKTGLLMSCFLVAYGIGNVCLSGLGDILGPKKSMIMAIIIWFVAMLVGGFATILGVMLLSRFLLGFGEGLHFPMMNTYCRAWFPVQEKAKASAIWFIGTSVAPAIGMPVFAWIVATHSWHWTFFFAAFIGLIPLFFLGMTADTPRQHKSINQAEIDYIEQGQVAGTEAAPAEPEGSAVKRILANLKVLSKIKLYWCVVVYYCVHNVVYWGLLTWLPAYLKTERGFSWSEMGFLASMPFILAIVCELIAGWASDKLGRRAPFIILATVGVAASLYFASTLTNNYASAICICLGMAAITPGAPLALTMLQELIPKDVISIGTGVMNGLSMLCAAISPVFLGYLMSVLGSFAAALTFLIAVALVGTVSAVILTMNKY